MDKEYINKVVEDIFVEGMSKLEIKTEVYKRLDKELKGEDRVHLKILSVKVRVSYFVFFFGSGNALLK